MRCGVCIPTGQVYVFDHHAMKTPDINATEVSLSFSYLRAYLCPHMTG